MHRCPVSVAAWRCNEQKGEIASPFPSPCLSPRRRRLWSTGRTWLGWCGTVSTEDSKSQNEDPGVEEERQGSLMLPTLKGLHQRSARSTSSPSSSCRHRAVGLRGTCSNGYHSAFHQSSATWHPSFISNTSKRQTVTHSERPFRLHCCCTRDSPKDWGGG